MGRGALFGMREGTVVAYNNPEDLMADGPVSVELRAEHAARVDRLLTVAVRSKLGRFADCPLVRFSCRRRPDLGGEEEGRGWLEPPFLTHIDRRGGQACQWPRCPLTIIAVGSGTGTTGQDRPKIQSFT